MSEGDDGEGAPIVIRPATEADIAAICSIYAWEVLNRASTFELTPPDEDEMRGRMRWVLAAGFPYLVATIGKNGGDTSGGANEMAMAGYAYAGPFRTRPAYRFTVEDSIYVSPLFQRRGVGRKLLMALVRECERLGFRKMMAVIADPESVGSVRFHEWAGFRRAGVWEAVGWKFGRWIDVMVMERALGLGAASAPE